MKNINTDGGKGFLERIASLAGHRSDSSINEIMRDADFRRRIERSTPAQIVHDLLIKLGALDKSSSVHDRNQFDAFIETQASLYSKLRKNADQEKLSDIDIENTSIVRENSALARAFEFYREAQIDHWGQSYDLRHYEARIQSAEDIGTFVVAQAWKQIEGT